MPQPVELALIEDPLAAAYTQAWKRILQEQEAIVADPLKLARQRRLAEMAARIEAITEELDDMAASWVRSQFPKVYGLGVADGAAAAGTSPIWSAIHQEAVEELAQSLFQDLLQATKGVNDSTKQLIRTTARNEALQQAIEGRTAKQAAKSMADILRTNHIHSVRYKNGAVHGLAEYTQMALRTKTATAYNVGTVNAAGDVKYFEVFDGPFCGWASHDDSQALGMIVTREEALAFPISHPNCRRAFGARPDITTKEQIDALRAEPGRVGAGQTTPGQREAQIEQDLAREARQRRIASSRAKKTDREAKKAARDARLAARTQPEPETLPSPAFAPPKQAAAPWETPLTYARVADVPSVTDLIDRGWGAEAAVVEQKRLVKNARNVERRARNKGKAGVTDTAELDATPDPVDALIQKDIQESWAIDNPVALYDPRLDGQGLGATGAWYARLQKDNAPGEWVPVRNLTIEGHKIRNGIAVQRNGRTYLLETGDQIGDTTHLAELQKHIDTVEGALQGVPVGLREYQRGVAIVKGVNPMDARWALKYDTPGFKSAATGGQGGTVFWNTEPRPGLILHEFGHNIDSMHSVNGRWITDLGPSDTQELLGDSTVLDWETSQGADRVLGGIHKSGGFQGSIHGHTITPGDTGITVYGANSKREDFAEAVRLYLADRHNGYLGYSGGDSVRFRDVFPERARFLDQLFGFEPDLTPTPWQTKQIDKAIKASDTIDIDSSKLRTHYGLPSHLHVQTLSKIEAAKQAKIAEEVAAAAKAAKEAAEAALQPTAADLTFGDKTGIGLKKSNAYKKAIAQGKPEFEAKAIAAQVEAAEIEVRLRRIAKERGVEYKPGGGFTTYGDLSRKMSPGIVDDLVTRAERFLQRAGKDTHLKAAAQANVQSQAKANIAAELADRLNNPKDWETFRAYRMRKDRYDGDPGEFASLTDRERHRLLEREASSRVQMWASTSGDHDENAVWMQMAIKEEFKVTGDAMPRVDKRDRDRFEAEYPKVSSFYRLFARRMYENTQEQLAREGIDQVSLYRGMEFYGSTGGRPSWATTGEHRPELQPANSWSTKEHVSRNFGTTMLKATIPRERILGTARTGFGCLNEWEYVVLDTDGAARVRAPQ